MRARAENGPLLVQAIAGAYVVILGIDIPDERSSRGVLGFAIERIDHANQRRDWLQGFKVFRNANLPGGVLASTHEHPLQSFLWSDFTVRNGHQYTYRVVAMRGQPSALIEGENVEVRITTENEDRDRHAIYFNRGVAGSQAYTRKFGNRRPDEVPNREAWRWLSRGLFEAMLDFIGKARGPSNALRVAVYEFNQGAVLQAFAKARQSGADIQIIYDARQIVNQENPNRSKLQPSEANRRAIAAAGLDDACIPRTSDPRAISHNKFIVLLENGEPTQVWTGSTNMTDGGIFGHSNVGHIVRDRSVAAKYLNYWEKLKSDPKMDRRAEDDELRPWNEERYPIPDAEPTDDITVIFSPRRTLAALEWYAQRMEAAKSAVFLTAAFGVNDLFESVFAQSRDYLRYILLETEDNDMANLLRNRNNRIAVGNLLSGNNAFETWLQEQRLLSEHLTGLNTHVKYIHTKYLLLDPLGDKPVVITGSANFSDASTRRNDENMLVIQGNKSVADIYLGEFMRLFKHFQFRAVAAAARNQLAEADSGFLDESDGWRAPFYEPGTVQYKERQYFSRAA
jgi:phosphatidylserine/phosphatidylglycerophosphate/cardiolipin synthase-like enzyme